jgi:hypothetical protein
MLEKTFVSQCLKRLRERDMRGGLWVPFPRTRFANAGVSDIVFISAALEIKAPGGRYGITPTQQAFLDKLNAAGGKGALVKSHDDLEAFINDWH